MKKYKDELDWVKINSVFERYNLDEVMNNLKALSLHWFGDEPESGCSTRWANMSLNPEATARLRIW